MKRLAFARNEPPIGFDAPPDSASPSAPAWASLAMIFAIVVAIAGSELKRAVDRVLAPPLVLAGERLFTKDHSRCCDANGNDLRPAQ